MPPIIPPEFWQSERERLLAVLLPHLEEAAAVGALLAGRKAPALSFDPDLHNRQAAAWARQHADELLGQLESTTGQTVGDIIGGWAETSGATMGELKAALREEFKTMAVERADRIAITEVTRAYAEGERITYQAAGIKRWTWRTNRDELVCKTCGPLNEKEVDIGRPFGKTPKGKDITEPPAHPNCRCWVAPVVEKAERPAPGQVQPNIPVTTAQPVPIPRGLAADLRFGPAQQAELLNRMNSLSAAERQELIETVMTPSSLPANRHALESLAELNASTAAERQALFERHLQSPNLRVFVGVNRRGRTHWHIVDLETGYISLYDEESGKHFSFHHRAPDDRAKFLEARRQWLVEVRRTEDGFEALKEWEP